KKLRTLTGHTLPPRGLCWSPGGQRLATASGAVPPDGVKPAEASGQGKSEGKLWNVETGAELRTLAGPTLLLTDVAWGPDGLFLAAVGSGAPDALRLSRAGEVLLWDAESGELRKRQATTYAMVGVAFLAGDQLMTIAAGQSNLGEWKTWQLPDLGPLRVQTPW